MQRALGMIVNRKKKILKWNQTKYLVNDIVLAIVSEEERRKRRGRKRRKKKGRGGGRRKVIIWHILLHNLRHAK